MGLSPALSARRTFRNPDLSYDAKIVGPVARYPFFMTQTYAITVFMSLNIQGHGGPVCGPVWPCTRRTWSRTVSTIKPPLCRQNHSLAMWRSTSYVNITDQSRWHR